jgi:predicted unusual protein kinase regulating ubiquinone biosynthesis (AarF/ABC1/UbiB family)
VELPRFIPEDLRQLARFVPARGWDAIEWAPLLGAMRKLSWRMASGSGVDGLRRSLAACGPATELGRSTDGLTPLADSSDRRQRQRCGDAILHLYFTQWRNDDGLFLDLRPSRFGLDGERVLFAPSGFWIRLRPAFREGMADLYRGFYSGDEETLDSALLATGMARRDLSASARGELMDLLQAHFGIEQKAQHFAIDRFKASFDALFDFFLAHDYKLHSDFVFVGFYLITLYLTLEQGGQAHNVRRSCEQALLDP